MNKIKFISLSKSCSLNESASSTGEFGGRSFRDCDVVYGPDGTRYIPEDICALVDNAIESMLNGIGDSYTTYTNEENTNAFLDYEVYTHN